MIETKYRKVFMFSLVASLGGLLFGFDIAIFSGTIPFITPLFELSPGELGWVASCLYVGCAIGSIGFGKITELMGRKSSLVLVSIIFIISSILMGLANTAGELILWRIVAGFSVGGASILSPLYIAEISPQAIRGKMVTLNQLAIVIGILLAYNSNYFLSHLELNWRLMFMSGCLPAGLFIIGAFFLPESPKWLIYKDKVERGRKELEKIVGANQVDEEVKAIQSLKVPKQKRDIKKSVLLIFSKKTYLFLLLIAIVVAVFQQISGANAVLFYAPIIFDKVGMDVNNQLLIQILIGSVNLVFTLLAIRLVDRVGRKKLMVTGAGLMAILLVLIGLSFQGTYIPQSLASVFVLLFIGTYAATLAPVTWVIISEIFPMEIREQGMAIASAFLWAACFGITYVFPVMIDMFSAFQSFLTFAGLCAFYFAFLIAVVPETKHNKV
ncbi:sugar porter family MFS transporter [Sphingobacterium sp. HMA12]|uniref:sugar porter family MFS transporter n=1 Tax=Sphingobacterium sp. HMA12 TaxID=2050894 RepID=UPI000CEA4011|nr:sugar porter family MFS transporter [Sphingobacterium sp. HMA12]